MHSLRVVYCQPPCGTEVLAERVLIPGVHQFAIAFWSFDDRNPQRVLSRDHSSAGRKETLPCIHNRRNMPLKKWQHASQLGENDIGTDGERYAIGKSLEKLDFVRTTVCSCNLTRHLDDFARLASEDSAGSKLA